MTIFGITGGIGTGKTLTLVVMGLKDLYKGKRLYSNIKFKGLAKYSSMITYLNRDNLKNMLEMVKTKQFDMRNSTVLIQEAHNYIDSRTAMFRDNRMISYWILQSRHTGEGSCDIIYDTQDIGQVDIRLRKNTDFLVKPQIVLRSDDKKRLPLRILLTIRGKIGHKVRTLHKYYETEQFLNKYDTHEVVDI